MVLNEWSVVLLILKIEISFEYIYKHYRERSRKSEGNNGKAYIFFF